MKKIILLSLIIFLLVSSVTGVSAQNSKGDIKDTSKIDSIVKYNDKAYDLSTLEGASQYFEDSNQIQTLVEVYDIDIFKVTKAVENTQSLIGLTSPSITSRSDVFDLESECKTNANIVKDYYDSMFKRYVNLGNNVVEAAANAYVSTGVFFGSMVRIGGPWDLKSTYSLSYTKYYSTQIDGQIVSLLGDDIGNIHYGYVGATMFPNFLLKSMAGIVQIAGGESNSKWFTTYFDDPRDQIAIQRGIDYYDDGDFE